MPSLGQIHIDQALTNVSVMYRNMAYVAGDVFPTVPVPKRSDKYFVYDKASFLSGTGLDAQGRPRSLRAPGAEAAEVDYTLSTQAYFAEEYAKRGIVTDAEVAYSDAPLQPETDQTLQLTEQLLIDNEMVVANIAGNTSNYPTANKKQLVSGAGTNPGDSSWNSYAQTNSNPFANIKAAKVQVISQIAKEPNAMFVGLDVARVLIDHPTIKDIVKYTDPETLTPAGLPKVLRGLTIMEGGAQKNTAAEGQPFSGGYIWEAVNGSGTTYNGMALIYHKAPAPGLRMVSFGYTFEGPDDTTGVRGLSVRRWREDKRKGQLVEVSFLRDWRFIAVDGSTNGWASAGLATGGYLIYDAIA
jgi:hypothetical protein